jgi:peptide/nickel transport system ATP-binding protein
MLLEIRDLCVDYLGRDRLFQPRTRVSAVRDVNLSLEPGQTLGLVGQSGSGKSTIGRAILGLVRPTSGRILFRGRDITNLSWRRRRGMATQIQVVFQDPLGSLSPVRTVGQTLAEPLRVHRRLRRAEVAARVVEMLDRVGLSPELRRRYPAELSGGQRQRVAIARALILEPALVVCDEPTSALDLSVQAQVLNLLLDLQAQLGVSYLFISHDIAAVRHMSHRMAVLLGGRLMDVGDVDAVTSPPRHPYTASLLAAAPVPDPVRQAQRRSATQSFSPLSRAGGGPGPGCPFAGRCPSEVEICRAVTPPLQATPDGAIACHTVQTRVRDEVPV